MRVARRLRDPAERQKRGERILDAAKDLLMQWGFEKVTMDDVALRADVGKGTVYQYWSTKESLVYAVVMREYLGTIRDELEAVRRDPFEATLSRFTRLKYLAVARRPITRAILGSSADALNGIFKAATTESQGGLDALSRDYLRCLMKLKLVRPDMDFEALSAGVTAVYTGFLLSDAASGESKSEGDITARADLLAVTIQRAFEAEADEKSMRVLARKVIELLEASASVCRSALDGSFRKSSAHQEDTQ